MSKGGAGRGQGRRALPPELKGKPVQLQANGRLLGMSGKEIRAAADWAMLTGYAGVEHCTAPDLKVGDAVSARIETHDSFRHESTRVVVDPIQRIDGVWLVGVQIFRKGVVMVPASEVKKK
jgi:hypothetical protein